MASPGAKMTLILGGARSGKSHFAVQLGLSSPQPVLFVATAEAGDEEMRQRIEAHKRARPATWRTLEVVTNVGKRIIQEIGEAQTVIIDCITLLVNNVFARCGEPLNASLVEQAVMAEIGELTSLVSQVDARFIIVSNEVGLGIVPADGLSRLYRDLLGKANQLLAQRADEVYLMVAGLPLPIKGDSQSPRS